MEEKNDAPVLVTALAGAFDYDRDGRKKKA